jgi:anti-sigma regulatory factor (Ser/Thr protein kinase)
MPRERELFLTYLPMLRAPSRARRELRRWLRDREWPLDAADDVVLAVSEAVSNSVEHGFRNGLGDVSAQDGITVRAAVEVHPDGTRCLLVTVADRGRWRLPPPRTDGRRRGLALIRAIAEEVRIDPTAHGTTVTFRTSPIDGA